MKVFVATFFLSALASTKAQDACIDWIIGFNLNGCTYDRILEQVEIKLGRIGCSHNALTEIQLITGTTTDLDAADAIDLVCLNGWDTAPQTTYNDIDYRFTDDFMAEHVSGEGFLNHETGSFQDAEYSEEGQNIKNFHDNEAKDTRMNGFEPIDSCKLNSMMCCFGRDRQPNDNNGNCEEPLEEKCVDADPADNSNLCYTNFDGTPYPGESEGDIHCHGLAWDDDPNEFTSQLKYNNLFFVSLYDHMYQRGYVEHLLDDENIPMCACMEDIDITVSRSDCTQIDASLTFSIKYEGGLVATAQDNLNIHFNTCRGINPGNGNGQNNDLASYAYKLYLEDRITNETKTEIFNTLVGYAQPGNNANEEACEAAYESAFAPRSYHEPNDDWIQVFGMGSEASIDTDLTLWKSGSTYVPDSGEFYIKRICPTCSDDHNQIIYKRLTPLPAGFDIPKLFLETWSSVDNELNVDFELYSNMLDALEGTARWDACNYDDPGIGFPRDCGPDKLVSHQWTSLSRGGRHQDYAYYVWEGNLNGNPAPAPGNIPTDADDFTEWQQVFGMGTEENALADSTFWEPGSLSGKFYIRRICPGCNDSHKDIVYKRLTPLPAGFDVENLFIGTWSSTDNVLGVDFELYSSMSYAMAGILSWSFCNYDDYDIAFPRDCGPSRAVGWQWTSLTRGGKPDYAYYVWNGNP